MITRLGEDAQAHECGHCSGLSCICRTTSPRWRTLVAREHPLRCHEWLPAWTSCNNLPKPREHSPIRSSTCLKNPSRIMQKNINAHRPEEFHWTNWTYSHEWISANFSMSVKEMARSICAIGKGSVACSTVDSTSWRARKGSGCREDRDDSPGCF